MKLLVPLALTLTGVGAGVGAGVLLRPGVDAADQHGQAAGHDAAAGHPAEARAGADGHAPAAPAGNAHGAATGGTGGTGGSEYVNLSGQFLVPILEHARVRSLVVLSVDLEVASGQSGTVYRLEPKIRDAFLTVLFDHANAGGFNGTFTSSGAMDSLRRALRESGRKAMGDALTDVLITGIVRQDV